jgi:hypothetical protein
LLRNSRRFVAIFVLQFMAFLSPIAFAQTGLDPAQNKVVERTPLKPGSGCTGSSEELSMKRHAGLLLLASAAALGCSTAQTTSSSVTAPTKSAKRGIAYSVATPADLQVLSPGVSWWYDWTTTPNSGVPGNYVTTYGLDYYPMLWNFNFTKSTVEAFIVAHPEIKYLMVLNEPNVSGQATCGSPTFCSPTQAAALWPQYEAIASDTGVQIVGPQITFGTEPGYSDPVVWLDAFIAAYQAANAGRSPRIDYLGFHWYDYGLGSQLDRLTKYGKPFWVTEFANWHSGTDGSQIDTLAKQEAQMTSMVSTLESRADVFRYAWFTGRLTPDPHFSSLLSGDGQLTDLGRLYLGLAFSTAKSAVTVSRDAPVGDAAQSASSGNGH